MFRKFSNKKGQEGGGAAAILVALIAFSILMYLLFIPPSLREDILEGNGDGIIDEEDEVSVEGSVLLLENPGLLSEEGSTSLSHSMPGIDLYLKNEGKVLENIGGVAVARSLFSEKIKTVPFFIENVDNVNNALLSFNTITAEGNLIIRLNGEEIYNNYVDGSIEPIVLRNSLLKEANILEFDVTGPGILFFLKNDYELTNVEIRADVLDDTHKEASTVFYVDQEEKNSLRRGELYFYPYCSDDADTLTVKLNGFTVFTGLPNCGYVNRFELAPEQINFGSNRLDFEIESGRYSITRLRYDSDLKNNRNKVYSFEVSDSQYTNISDKDYEVYVRLKFPDDYESKEGRIYVNGYIKSYDTEEASYTAKITEFITEDFNSVKIVPEGSYELVELKVWLKEE